MVKLGTMNLRVRASIKWCYSLLALGNLLLLSLTEELALVSGTGLGALAKGGGRHGVSWGAKTTSSYFAFLKMSVSRVRRVVSNDRRKEVCVGWIQTLPAGGEECETTRKKKRGKKRRWGRSRCKDKREKGEEG